jgi:membrane protein involved in colicin uptake
MLAAVIKEAARGDFQNAVSSSNSSGSGSDSGSGNSGKNSSDGGGNSGNGSSAGAKKSKASGGGSAAAGGLTPADMAESVRSFQVKCTCYKYIMCIFVHI